MATITVLWPSNACVQATPCVGWCVNACTMAFGGAFFLLVCALCDPLVLGRMMFTGCVREYLALVPSAAFFPPWFWELCTSNGTWTHHGAMRMQHLCPCSLVPSVYSKGKRGGAGAVFLSRGPRARGLPKQTVQFHNDPSYPKPNCPEGNKLPIRCNAMQWPGGSQTL